MKIIKRYANRKLYDTERSCYVTLNEIADMVRAGDELQIVDQKTNEDLTSITLTQILLEEEKRSKRILPLSALRSIIQSGGDFFLRMAQPVQQFREETHKSVDRLLKPPGDAIQDTRAALRDFGANLTKTIDEMQARMDERLRDAIDTLTHLPELAIQLEGLDRRLAEWEARLDTLERAVAGLNQTRSGPSEPTLGPH
jgi:polyhydroxyalkanoate synthesis repressor PhaR